MTVGSRLDNLCYMIEVHHFEVWDAGATTQENFLGDVYLDLYPRGKFPCRISRPCSTFDSPSTKKINTVMPPYGASSKGT